MGDLEAFDPSQAALDWLRGKIWRGMLPEKAQQQEWFLAFIKKSPYLKSKKILIKQKR